MSQTGSEGFWELQLTTDYIQTGRFSFTPRPLMLSGLGYETKPGLLGTHVVLSVLLFISFPIINRDI